MNRVKGWSDTKTIKKQNKTQFRKAELTGGERSADLRYGRVVETYLVAAVGTENYLMD